MRVGCFGMATRNFTCRPAPALLVCRYVLVCVRRLPCCVYGVHRRDTFELGFVTLHLRIVRETSAQFADDSGDVCVGWLRKAIVGPFAVATGGDESGAAKVSEVTRDFWLIGFQNLD